MIFAIRDGQKSMANHSRPMGFSAATSLWHFKPITAGSSLNLRSTHTLTTHPGFSRPCAVLCIISLRSKNNKATKRKKMYLQHKYLFTYKLKSRQFNKSTHWKTWSYSEEQNLAQSKLTIYIFSATYSASGATLVFYSFSPPTTLSSDCKYHNTNGLLSAPHFIDVHSEVQKG